MNRITLSDLEAVCKRINRTVNGAELQPWEKLDDGSYPGYRQVPGAYVLDGAYGGYALHRNCDIGTDGESHGVSDVFGGHMPKRELYDRMQAFLRGVETAEDEAMLARQASRA